MTDHESNKAKNAGSLNRKININSKAIPPNTAQSNA